MDLYSAKRFILAKLHAMTPDFRTYHAMEHTLDVLDAAMRLADREGVEGEERQLLATAALFHDAGYIVQAEGHERGSCKLAKEHLPHYGYNEQQIVRICRLIMATGVPQGAQDTLSMILCDADLDYLGRDDFVIIGDRLYHEFRVEGVVEGRWEWNVMQAKFLEEHRYYTASANKLRRAKKRENLAGVQQWLQAHSGKQPPK